MTAQTVTVGKVERLPIPGLDGETRVLSVRPVRIGGSSAGWASVSGRRMAYAPPCWPHHGLLHADTVPDLVATIRATLREHPEE